MDDEEEEEEKEGLEEESLSGEGGIDVNVDVEDGTGVDGADGGELEEEI